MKKVIIAMTLFCTFGAVAQTKKPVANPVSKTAIVAEKLSPDEAAQKNVNDLNAFSPLTNDQKALLLGLFKTKHETLVDSELFSAERKAVLTQSITSKMESLLPASVMTKVKANTALFQSLVN
jgi:hypothetical protein